MNAHSRADAAMQLQPRRFANPVDLRVSLPALPPIDGSNKVHASRMPALTFSTAIAALLLGLALAIN